MNKRSIEISGLPRQLVVRENARAKKLILRYDSQNDYPIMTVPLGTSEAQVRKFANRHISWILEQIDNAQGNLIGHSDQIPFLGTSKTLDFTDSPPRRVTLEDDRIVVGGPIDQAGPRLERWLRAQAKNQLTKACQRYAEQISAEYSRISVGDMKSRWGSCSSKGTLRFSWRLIMAPEEILNYVAAHEVCHLREMNHSPAFWAWVAECMPDYQSRRKYLKQQGQSLMDIRLG
jgi:predicted metal-dependent hydrolase